MWFPFLGVAAHPDSFSNRNNHHTIVFCAVAPFHFIIDSPSIGFTSYCPACEVPTHLWRSALLNVISETAPANQQTKNNSQANPDLNPHGRSQSKSNGKGLPNVRNSFNTGLPKNLEVIELTSLSTWGVEAFA